MNKCCVLFVCVVSLCLGQVQGEPIQIYILAGQSNMIGSGLVDDLPAEPFDYTQPQQVPYSYDYEFGQKVSSGFEFLRPGVFGNSFGAELSFGRRIDEATTTPIGLIKVAANGTSLAKVWNPDVPIPERAMYPILINHVQSTLAQIGVQGIDYQIAGFLWTQGESDTNDVSAPLYHDNLVNFIQRVRTDLNTPQLPFYISRFSQYTNLRNRSLIRQAQADIAREDPFTTAVATDLLPLKLDLVHYTSDGQLGLGEAFADAVLLGPPKEDFDGDGLVGDNDLNIVVGNWNLSVQPGAGNGDVDGDGFVGLADLKSVVDLIVPPPPPLGSGDLTGDGFVGLSDLNRILPNWNQSVIPGDFSKGDLTGDGFIGLEDLNRVLAQWNSQDVDPELFEPTLGEMDLDASGTVEAGDVEMLLAQWSLVDEGDADTSIGSEASPVPADFNADGVIDVEDLRFLLEVVPTGLKLGAADLDADGFVGISDLNRVLANWNQSVNAGDPSQGDVNGDGFIGIDDINAVLGNWNTGTPPPGVLVPEPAMGLVLLIPLLIRGRRNRGRLRTRSTEGNTRRAGLVSIVMLLALAPVTQAQQADSLINSGTRDWVAAATTGRADMLIIGDSIVNHGLGWTGGIAHAASSRIGLAGTGLAALGLPAKSPGEGGGSLILSQDWSRSVYTLPEDLWGYSLGSRVSVLWNEEPTARFWQAMGLYDNLLDGSAAYDWQLWASATGGVDGSIQGLRATRVLSPFNRQVLQTSDPVVVTASTNSLQLIELPFAAAPGQASDWQEFALINTSKDTAVFYNRLIAPDKTGITVTGWSYPGGTMNDFVTDLYDNGRFHQDGRAAYLSALVQGNSGKLNVVIAMGDNDSGETEASLTLGITPGYSAEAFVDNVKTQIALVTADWAHAGLPAGDLSFTLSSTYQIGPELLGADRVARLEEYRDALRVLAGTDSRFSFIDMWGASPTAQEAVAKNYIHDGEHPSQMGSLLYGALFMNELLETVPITGDLDGDGFVGLNDLMIVLGNWNVSFVEPWNNTLAPNDYRADPTYDELVGINDLNLVLANWNAGAPPGTTSPIPEPATGVVFMGLFSAWMGVRRRRS